MSRTYLFVSDGFQCFCTIWSLKLLSVAEEILGGSTLGIELFLAELLPLCSRNICRAVVTFTACAYSDQKAYTPKPQTLGLHPPGC